MNRQELIDALEIVEPARSPHVIVPLLTHFWFYKGNLIAFNDQIGVEVPFDLGFDAAVPGFLLPGLKGMKGVEEIDLDCDDRTLLVKGGRSKLTLTVLDTAACKQTFVIPDYRQDKYLVKFASTDDARISFEYCLNSVSLDSSDPEKMGVTLKADGEGFLKFYSTDDSALTAIDVKASYPKAFKHACLSPQWVKQFMRLSKSAEKVGVWLRPDCSVAEIDDIVLFGKLIDVPGDPMDFENIIEQHITPHTFDEMVVFPRVGNMIERAMAVPGDGREDLHTHITIKSGDISFVSSGGVATLEDHAKIDKAHPDCKVICKVKPLQYGHDKIPEAHIMFTARSVVMGASKGKGKGDILYMVATRET